MHKMVSNEEIYELLLQVSKRLDNLERCLSSGETDFLPIPETTIDEWLEDSEVRYTDIYVLVSYKEGPMDAIKQYIMHNHRISALPLYNKRNKTMIAVQEDDAKIWKYTEHALEYFIREVWRKFVKYTKDHPFTGIDQDIVDIYKQKIMGMNQTIYGTLKNRKEITKWLTTLC